MTEPAYPRHIQATLDLALGDTPVVALLGPRQCGKSTLVRALAPERPYYSLDEDQPLAFARSDPGGFIAALPSPVTIDEVQRAPELFRAIKQRSVDDPERDNSVADVLADPQVWRQGG